LRTPFIFGLILSALALPTIAAGQSAAPYHSGKLLQMESVQCVVESETSATSSKPCQEYVLQGEGVLFHLHAKKGSEATLLPVGKMVAYRLVEGRFYLKLSGHDREYAVVAMEPQESHPANVHSAQAINHLQ
jgi:hypothetical protein